MIDFLHFSLYSLVHCSRSSSSVFCPPEVVYSPTSLSIFSKQKSEHSLIYQVLEQHQENFQIFMSKVNVSRLRLSFAVSKKKPFKSLDYLTLPRENNVMKAYLKIFIVIPSHTVAVVSTPLKSQLGIKQ